MYPGKPYYPDNTLKALHNDPHARALYDTWIRRGVKFDDALTMIDFLDALVGVFSEKIAALEGELSKTINDRPSPFFRDLPVDDPPGK